jgi:hypothetical protein
MVTTLFLAQLHQLPVVKADRGFFLAHQRLALPVVLGAVLEVILATDLLGGKEHSDRGMRVAEKTPERLMRLVVGAAQALLA